MIFLGETGNRLDKRGVHWAIRAGAERAGMSNPDSANPSGRFFVHWFRHGFTTQLLKGGVPSEYVASLRGDAHLNR